MESATANQHLATDELLASAERYRVLFDHNPTPLLVFAVGTWEILDVNPAAVSHYGYSREEFLALTLREIRTPEEVAKLPELARQGRLNPGQPVLTQHLKKDGVTFDAEIVSHEIVFAGRQARLAVVSDVTERNRILAQLSESEANLRLALNAAEMVIWKWDIGADKTELNGRALRLPWAHGLSSADFLNAVHPDDREMLQQSITRVLTEGGKYQPEFRVLTPTGEVRWVVTYGWVIHDAEGRPMQLLGVSQDITERRRTTEQLRESEERLRLALNAVKMYSWDWDIDKDESFHNPMQLALLGVIPRNFAEYAELVHPDDQAGWYQAYEEAVQRRENYTWEYRVIRPDGKVLWVLDCAHITYHSDGAPSKMFGVTLDITERKRTEEELRWAHEQLQLRLAERTELMRRVVTAHENERKQLARELHDQMGQHVAALKLSLNRLLKSERLTGGERGHLAQAWELTEQIGNEVHSLTKQLRPTGLDDLGLHVVLTNYIEEWSSRTQIPVDLQCIGCEGHRLPPELEITLYRIVQEALTNVLKHAQARNVCIILEKRGPSIRAIIEDDGCGFDPEAQRQTARQKERLGLLGISERVELANGTFEIESAPGKGTTLFINLPLPAATP